MHKIKAMAKGKGGASAKHEALEMKKTDNTVPKHKMHKVHHSTEYCKHCGEKTSTSTRQESGHREYDHERSSHPSIA